jgi:hypothetical protein
LGDEHARSAGAPVLRELGKSLSLEHTDVQRDILRLNIKVGVSRALLGNVWNPGHE